MSPPSGCQIMLITPSWKQGIFQIFGGLQLVIYAYNRRIASASPGKLIVKIRIN